MKKLAALAARIPAAGIQGKAIREAAATEFGDIRKLVVDELTDLLYPNAQDGSVYLDVEALFADSIVIERDSRYWSYPYTIDATNQVTFGKAFEVVESYQPAGGDNQPDPDGDGSQDMDMQPKVVGVVLTEAAGGETPGTVWDARIIEAGLSGNGNLYPESMLKEAVPLFEGARVFMKADAEHLAGGGKDVGKLIGWIDQPRFVEAAGGKPAYIGGRLNILASEGKLREGLVDAFRRGKPDLVGLSIDATGPARMARQGDKIVRVVEAIRKVKSVDLIVEPGAGGRLMRLVESYDPQEGEDMKLRESMLRLLEAQRPELYRKIDPQNITDEALEQTFKEALGDKNSGEQPAGISREDLQQTVQLLEARAHARVAIAGSGLPDLAKARLTKLFGADATFTEAQVDEAITGEREYLAKLTESGRVQMGGLDVEAGEDRADKVAKMLDDFFAGKVKSFRECYAEITGDMRVTGNAQDCDMRRLREAVPADLREALTTASFANVLGNSLHRTLVPLYNTDNQYTVWRQLTGNPVPLQDFRTNERTRYGGYGDLTVVAEGDPYPALASPTDEKATYAATKKGGTESVTIEMIRNDDVGAIRRIPVQMTRSAQRTLGKFVLDFLATNPNIYDGTALFTVGHGNLGSAALDSTTLAAARLAMLKQTELDSAAQLGIGPINMWVPFDLQETAANLFRRNTNLDKTFLEDLTMNIIPVWYWTDVNNWFVTADTMDIPCVELGFLDGNEVPEIFVQDNPQQGSLFSNDRITYKIRHIYGGNVIDYRGMYGAIVA